MKKPIHGVPGLQECVSCFEEKCAFCEYMHNYIETGDAFCISEFEIEEWENMNNKKENFQIVLTIEATIEKIEYLKEFMKEHGIKFE